MYNCYLYEYARHGALLLLSCGCLQQIICSPSFVVTMNTTALLSLTYPCDPGIVVDTPVSWHPSYNLNLPHIWEAHSINNQGAISFVFHLLYGIYRSLDDRLLMMCWV